MFGSNRVYLKLYNEIEKLEVYNERLILEKEQVMKEKREMEEKIQLLEKIKKVVTSNTYGNESILLRKIKELLTAQQ